MMNHDSIDCYDSTEYIAYHLKLPRRDSIYVQCMESKCLKAKGFSDTSS